MKWLLAVVAGLLVVVPLSANFPPGPLAIQDHKLIPFKYRIVTSVEYPDYEFYIVDLRKSLILEPINGVTPVKLDPNNPVSFKTTIYGESSACGLVAVPKGAGKKYANDDEFHQALVDGTVAGQVPAKTTLPGDRFIEVEESDPRKEVVEEYTVEAIDPKLGIVLTKSATPELKTFADAPTGMKSAAPPSNGSTWVAGLAGACAVVFGGLWVVRRGRRELA